MAETTKSPWKEMMTVTIPKRHKKDKRRHVQVNGKFFNCKVGVPIEVPKPVALVIEQSIAQHEAYEALIEKIEAGQGN